MNWNDLTAEITAEGSTGSSNATITGIEYDSRRVCRGSVFVAMKGGTTDGNKFAEKAIEQYQDVLQRGPKNINSVKGIAYLYLNMKKFDQAKEYYRKASELDPNDPEPYYSIAVIDWTQTYQPRMEERAKLGMKPEDSLPTKDKKVCAAVRDKNSANIQ